MSKGLFPKAASSNPLAGSGSDLLPVSFFKKYISISASPHTLLVFIAVIGCQLYLSVSGVVTGKGMSGYTNNAVSSPNYWVPLRTAWREKAIYGDCNLGYFHCSESGCFHEALGCLFSQAFKREKELCLPPKEKDFIWAFYDSSWCVSVYLGGKDWEIYEEI